jgi:hypothetical protein
MFPSTLVREGRHEGTWNMTSATDDENEPILEPVSRTRQKLGIGNTTAWKLIGQGDLETVSIGRKRLVVVASRRAYVARLRAAAQGRAA